jgi:hypothetical protein
MKRSLRQAAIVAAMGPWTLACLGGAMLFCGGCRALFPRMAHEVMMRQFLAEQAALQRPMKLYARVVDQNGEPVAGAAAECEINTMPTSIRGTSGISKVTRKTDEDGRFSVEAPKGLSLTVLGVSAKGYAYDRKDNPFEFFFSSNLREDTRHHPDKEKPVRFLLRRRGEQVLLLGGGISAKFSDDKRFPEQALGRPVNIAVMCVSRGLGILKRERPRPDLTFTAEPGATFKVTFTALGKTVFQHSDEKLYLAPKDGYDKKTWTITVPKGYDRDKKTYLYVKSDAPPLYTRVEMTFSPSDDSIFVRGKRWTNPYGDRRLEQLSEEDLKQKYPGLWTSRLISELEKRIRPAWLKGRVAEKPDIDAIIKANPEKLFWK